MKTSLEATHKHSTNDVLRFAHPFFTDKHPEERTNIEGVGKRMTDYVKTKLEDIPVPQRDPAMKLKDIIGDSGVAAINEAGSIWIHAVGDTGTPGAHGQQMVADIMAKDYAPSQESPAFFFHLGDVDYYDNTDSGYHEQFYEPYRSYPGKIIAIPGNHDGELFKYDGTSTGQKTSLEEFQKNFCQPVTGVPPAAGTIYREMISQPAVFWYLDTPFLDIIALYSNVAENPGYIVVETDAVNGNIQKDWLKSLLTKLKAARDAGTQKGLLIATHHPPFSSGHHSSSTDMLIDIDECCSEAGIMPDAFVSAHAHNLQCYTRYVSFNGGTKKTPFVVCGGGGRTPQHVPAADSQRVEDKTKLTSYHTFDKSLTSYGYMDIKARANELTLHIHQISEAGAKTLFQSISVPICQ